MENETFIGLVSIKHHLTDKLKIIGGHITYFIRPSRRNRGYGSRILKLALQKLIVINIAIG